MPSPSYQEQFASCRYSRDTDTIEEADSLSVLLNTAMYECSHITGDNNTSVDEYLTSQDLTSEDDGTEDESLGLNTAIYEFSEDSTASEDESDNSSGCLNTAVYEFSDVQSDNTPLVDKSDNLSVVQNTCIEDDDSADATLVPKTYTEELAVIPESSIDVSAQIIDLTTITSTIDSSSSILQDLSSYPDEAASYQRIKQIGEGSYGLVYEAIHRETGETVAIKEIKIRYGKLHSRMATEIDILKQLKHEHIVSLKEVCRNENTLSLVFEKCSQDLKEELISTGGMNTSSACHIMMQILSGLAEMHNNGFMHRDLKPANILMKGHTLAKIGDLGLARDYTQPTSDCPNAYSPDKGTVRYRPPEIFFGSENYGPSIDIWSAGLIFLELVTGERVLKGDSQLEIVVTISELCGSISPDIWPEVLDLPYYSLFTLPINSRNSIDDRFGDIIKNDLILGLIKLMLSLNPLHRPTAQEALKVLNKYVDDSKPS